jgi:hypothetical protein
MDIALTILALIQGGALVHFHYKYNSLSVANAKILTELSKALDSVQHLNSAIVKNEPTERLTLLEQKVAAIQMKR